MKNIGIICEYNPFHKGHLEQIKYVRDYFAPEEVTVISLMSGNFVQRGDFSVYPKYIRAEAAISCGADLVLELPFPFSMGSAAVFADSAVSILEKLSCVDYLFFGSESGDTDQLKRISERLMSKEFDDYFKKSLASYSSTPESYAGIRSEVYKCLYGQELLKSPNDILGIEYMIALNKRNSQIVPVAHKRVGGYSATASRAAVKDGADISHHVPEAAKEIFSRVNPTSLADIDKALLGFYRVANVNGVSYCAENELSLTSRIIKYSRKCSTFAEVLERTATKKYTNARIRRAAIYGYVGVHGARLKEEPMYTRLLAANGKGCELLKSIKKTSRIPVITKPSDADEAIRSSLQYECEEKAELVYALACENLPQGYGNRPIIVDNKA